MTETEKTPAEGGALLPSEPDAEMWARHVAAGGWPTASMTREHLPALVAALDEARRERDTARAEADRLREHLRAIADAGCEEGREYTCWSVAADLDECCRSCRAETALEVTNDA